MKEMSQFSSLDYGTRITTRVMEDVEVQVDPEVMLQDYAKATIREMRRMNPLRFDSINKDESKVIIFDEMTLHTYFVFLLAQRIKSIHGKADHWVEMRHLWMPNWIQFALSRVGEVVVHEKGLVFIPVFKSDSLIEAFTIEQAHYISTILRMFKQDGLSVTDNGFPRQRTGERDTMSFALIGSKVDGTFAFGAFEVQPVNSYIASFLGFKVKESLTKSYLYTIRYDDVNSLMRKLLNDERLF